MGKRPSGFGKASKQKKQKSDTPEQGAETPEGEPEINIELQDETTDDELAEIYGLYAKLREERDPRIARGLIHECDQLLRARDAKGETLPAKFHIAYGAALLTLANPELGENEERANFGEAGVHRLQVGLEELAKLAVEERALAAAELIQYVHTQAKDAQINKINQKLIVKAKKLLKTEETSIELVRAAVAMLQLAEDCGGDTELLAFVERLLKRQLVKSSDTEMVRAAYEGRGQYFLIAAAPGLEAIENEEVDTADEDLKNLVMSAVSSFEEALTEAKPSTYVMLAEALLQWSSLGECDERKVVGEALKHLKKAQILGAENLHEIIESLENPEEE